jgi:2-polyprenyl-3-methyl-5-hydroxy-6-metoxy-1,4-benzoquinol methylase
MLTVAVAVRSPDFARTASDYARHRAGLPAELLDRLAARGVARAGARVADLGTGTGSLARLFAAHGCVVTGVDIAAPLIEQARRLDREADMEMLAERFPEDPLTIPHRVWAVTARLPAS